MLVPFGSRKRRMAVPSSPNPSPEPGPRHPRGRVLLALAWALATPTLASACATCGCSLSTDGAFGTWSIPGWRLSLQYDYLDQDQLRSGTRAVASSLVAALNTPAPGAGQEVERRTLNRYTTLGLSYAPSSDWDVKVLIPRVDRFHTTYGTSANPLGPAQLSAASATSLGDVKVIGSYQGFLPGHDLGLQFGLKLPTGAYGGQNAAGGPIVGRHPVAFGPAGAFGGTLLDASLQPGTGSTDLLLGAYYVRPVGKTFEAFVSGQFQAAFRTGLDQAGSEFRPGDQGTLSFGLRYEAAPAIIPQIQVNLMHRCHDQGALADRQDSAGTMAYLSPGVTGNLQNGLSAFAFLQLPVASNLSGYQLAPRWTASAGLAFRF